MTESTCLSRSEVLLAIASRPERTRTNLVANHITLNNIIRSSDWSIIVPAGQPLKPRGWILKQKTPGQNTLGVCIARSVLRLSTMATFAILCLVRTSIFALGCIFGDLGGHFVPPPFCCPSVISVINTTR